MLDKPTSTVFSGFVLRGRSFLPTDPLSNNFKSYVFFTNSFRKEMIIKSSMTTRALTSGTALSQMKFRYPSFKEQILIGKTLDTLDHLVASNQQQQKSHDF